MSCLVLLTSLVPLRRHTWSCLIKVLLVNLVIYLTLVLFIHNSPRENILWLLQLCPKYSLAPASPSWQPKPLATGRFFLLSVSISFDQTFGYLACRDLSSSLKAIRRSFLCPQPTFSPEKLKLLYQQVHLSPVPAVPSISVHLFSASWNMDSVHIIRSSLIFKE